MSAIIVKRKTEKDKWESPRNSVDTYNVIRPGAVHWHGMPYEGVDELTRHYYDVDLDIVVVEPTPEIKACNNQLDDVLILAARKAVDTGLKASVIMPACRANANAAGYLQMKPVNLPQRKVEIERRRSGKGYDKYSDSTLQDQAVQIVNELRKRGIPEEQIKTIMQKAV